MFFGRRFSFTTSHRTQWHVQGGVFAQGLALIKDGRLVSSFFSSSLSSSSSCAAPFLRAKKRGPSVEQKKRMRIIGQLPVKSAESAVQEQTGLNTTAEECFQFTGFELVFLGTAAGSPTLQRGASSIAFRTHGQNWLFDCGEDTARQLKRSNLSSSSTNKIFITHLHGDHIFGLPGLLCSLDVFRSSRDKGIEDAEPMEISIYGPVGVFDYVNASILASQAKLRSLRLTIYELLDRSVENQSNGVGLYTNRNYSPVHKRIHRQVIACNRERGKPPSWDVFEDSKMRVVASSIRHTIPCFGYVVEEKSRPGTLDKDAVIKLGLRPGPQYKLLKEGKSIRLLNGAVIDPKDVVGPPHLGRKAVILGDTYDASNMVPFSRGADIVIHEATLEPGTPTKKAVSRGHSTARMAGEFAQAIDAKSLAITHFGQRVCDYVVAENGHSPVQGHVDEARSAFGRRAVFAAIDFMRIPVPLKKS